VPTAALPLMPTTTRSPLSALLAALATVILSACGALGADRAIDEAADMVVRLPCAPDREAGADLVAPCEASNKTVFFAVSAREYLSEARRRAHHGDHAQAERFAVLARKAAEEALRSQVGQ